MIICRIVLVIHAGWGSEFQLIYKVGCEITFEIHSAQVTSMERDISTTDIT